LTYQVQLTKRILSSEFDMKGMGQTNVILGIQIVRDDESITLNQSHYIEKVLKRFNHTDCAPVSTPFDPSVKLVKNTGFHNWSIIN